ncbi:YeiH family protein [Gayadomonas joobiniege]|uniref:YeiH family protein n=1 Tax=Gayadomonas joobiniege TaxID=1234606 RepID=UPI00036A73CC|nr:YeiH family protein [Gayadomonas joobiniege]
MANLNFSLRLPNINHTLAERRWWLGLVLVGVIAALAINLSHSAWLQPYKLSPLTIGIVLGVMIGNTIFSKIAKQTDIGVDYAKSWLLKAGVILFGFKITFSQVASVGWQGMLTDAIMLSGTFLLAICLTKKVFNLDEQTAILIGAGSSICGAAAVMATEPVIRAQAHKVSVAVATVVVFGTLSMFAYPMLYPYMGISEHAYGIFVGSTIHEVAQVVAAGNAVSKDAADIAVIEKMLRVMLLAPFLFILSFYCNRKNAAQTRVKEKTGTVFIPWFALFFIMASGINSLGLLSNQLIKDLAYLDNILLTVAMVALGLRTHVGAIRQAGVKPLLLAGCLFMFLTVGGFLINAGIAKF